MPTQISSVEEFVVSKPAFSCTIQSPTKPEPPTSAVNVVYIKSPPTQTSSVQDFVVSDPEPSCSFHCPSKLDPVTRAVKEQSTQTRPLRKRKRRRQRLLVSQEITEQQFREFCDKHFSRETSAFIKAQLQLLKTKPKGSRFPNAVMQFALPIYFTSPLAYYFLSRMFRPLYCLQHESPNNNNNLIKELDTVLKSVLIMC